MRLKRSIAESPAQNSTANRGKVETLEEFQRRYFPKDFQVHTTVDSADALIQQVTEQSVVTIKTAFAEAR